MASTEQKELMKQFQGHWCFEFMHSEEARADDPAGFVELWETNIDWLQDHVTVCSTMIDDYRKNHGV